MSRSAHSSSSVSRVVGITRSSPLLDIIPPVRLLMLDCMDDRTATRYLTTCKLLHASYHAYPLKWGMSVRVFREYTHVKQHLVHGERATQAASAPVTIVGMWQWALTCHHIVRMLFTRSDCCASGRSSAGRRLLHPLPRGLRLSEELRDVRLLPYLQHLTELTAADNCDWPMFRNPRLPLSLRTLHLKHSPSLTLESHTLPPRLTSLTLGAVGNQVLPNRCTA